MGFMVDIVKFEDAKLPHARKRRDARAKALKKAFAAARTEADAAPPKQLKKPSKKKSRKKKK